MRASEYSEEDSLGIATLFFGGMLLGILGGISWDLGFLVTAVIAWCCGLVLWLSAYHTAKHSRKDDAEKE